jgi:hypothetical protein
MNLLFIRCYTKMTIPSFTRLVRFVPRSDESKICIGEPESNSVDVEAALRNDQPVSAFVWSGNSVLSPGIKTADREVIGRLLSPVAPSEVGTIRCLGLNVSSAICTRIYTESV